MKKIIILSISILVTLVGTFLLGLYDFKVWLSPTGKNATTITTEYRSYLVENIVDFKNNETPIENTKGKISLSRLMANYKYSVDPIYHNENEYFTIDVYQNQFWYVNSDLNKETEHYRYEVFIYNVNYELLRDKFKAQSVPGKKIVEEADYPYLVVNFFPNDEFNQAEGMIYPKFDSTGAEVDTTSPIIFYDGEKTYSHKLNSQSEVALFDYSSTPSKNKTGDVFYVNFLAFYDYSSYVGGDDRLYEDNRDLFDNGGFVKVDAVLTIEDKTESINYGLSQSLLEAKIDDFTFDTTELANKDLKTGFKQSSDTGEAIRAVKIDGVKTFNSWVVGKYLWWHCLCAFAVIGLIMTGFYFIFTYEEKGKTKKLANKKKK